MLDMTRSMRATPLQVLWKVRFPTALPHMFAGMKVAISLALVGAIAGEFVASQVGLGYVILTSRECSRYRAFSRRSRCSECWGPSFSISSASLSGW